jgi:hypothetical protein
MPIDNVTLLRHENPPSEPPRRRPWWVAPLVLLAGAAILLTAAWFAWGDDARTRIVAGLYCLYAVLFFLWRLRIGWLEDGVFGVWYREEHPMGSMLAGDEERDGLANSASVLAGLAVILVIVLAARSPGAFSKQRASSSAPTAPVPSRP